MIRNKKKGFTLVELLAVIVILAIILVIAVPKIVSIIEDAKKGTLESTAKMIASSAEKQKVQNTVLGNNDAITCESVAKLNNSDYESCSIEFDGNTAKVTLKGKGKFVGLNVCGGTKTVAEASNEVCKVKQAAKAGALTITNLLAQESTLNNGLVQTTAEIDGKRVDAGIRYVGDDPNNIVYFNCSDTDTNGVSYGEEGYSYEDACEQWEIIGVFDVEDGKGNIEKRIKLTRMLPLYNAVFDSSSADINDGGKGINQWGKSVYEDGTLYEGADLMRALNGYYIGESDTCSYCDIKGYETCQLDCSSSITPLGNIALSMIDNAIWYTGATVYDENLTITRNLIYAGERGTVNGKGCVVVPEGGEEDPECNDKVVRTTSWLGKVGLIYASDFLYAGTNENCTATECTTENNWLSRERTTNTSYPGSFTISPILRENRAMEVYSVFTTRTLTTTLTLKQAGNFSGRNSARASLYLKADVEIVDGNGTLDDEPYILK